ncbi:MAG: hypothetical protein F4Y49_01230 [Dehalococcoidia bacterium]|nr:hypothetical protein [Dehalococcoidia bacterium]
MSSDTNASPSFDLLAELARFGLDHRISLNDPKAIPEFSTFVENVVRRALSQPNLLHGRRTEAMFESMLLSLGGYSLLKTEDNGDVHPNDEYLAPDFRVVLPDGTQWLIEVKNAYIEDPFRQERQFMVSGYREKLERYASATGGKLKLAVYWARWGIWTLVSPERFLDAAGNVSMDMQTGMMENELVHLGDQMIGTRPPLKLRLEVDPTTTEPVAADGTVKFTISGVRLYCGEEELLDSLEKEIAWTFMRYGRWRMDGPQPDVKGDRLIAAEFRWDPEENTNQGFETIGTLSEMFCRYYSEQTLLNQEVVQLLARPRPGWFAPLVGSEYDKKVLPLWQFKLYPRHSSTSQC